LCSYVRKGRQQNKKQNNALFHASKIMHISLRKAGLCHDLFSPSG
jgi:hypothetical protein